MPSSNHSDSMRSNRSGSNSFSLSSAGGMVSLLNDEGAKGESSGSNGDKKQTSTAYDGLRLTVGDGPRGQYRSGNSSTSSSNTPTPSPFDSHPSGSGGESNGSTSAVTSIPPSTDSSRDDSVDASSRKPINSRTLSEESDDSSVRQDNQHHHLAGSQTRTARAGTASSSSQSDDGNEAIANAQLNARDSQHQSTRRRLSDSRADETVQSRRQSMRRMLDHSRLARSPPPIQGFKRTRDESHIDSSSNDTHASRTYHDDNVRQDVNEKNDVPMNMHRATARSHGGFHGKTELDHGATADTAGGESKADDGTTAGGHQSTGHKTGGNSQIVNGKKRYPCSFPGCEKTFSTSGHAARHNRIHTGSKPYRCTFPGCNASFSRQDNSLQHYRTHVLHPKSRSGGSVNLDATQMDAAAIETELQSLDPETVATVQMGRKALEEGTAIAVVQEFIDGNGRRAEAVQRMVGQPKSGRRGSNAMQEDSISELGGRWNEPPQSRRRMSLDTGYDASSSQGQYYDRQHHPPSHGWHHPAPPPPPYGPAYQPHPYDSAVPPYAQPGGHYQHPPPPSAYPPQHESYATTSQHPTMSPPQGPMYAPPSQHHAYGQPPYPPHALPPLAHSAPSPQSPVSDRRASASTVVYTDRPGTDRMMPAPTWSEHARPSPAYASAGPSNFEHGYGGRLRRSSEIASTAYHPSTHEHSAAFGPPPSAGSYHHHSPSSSSMYPPHESRFQGSSRAFPPDDMTSVASKGHRRASSAVYANGYAQHPQYLPSRQVNVTDGRAFEFGRREYGQTPKEAHSPTFSVRSFRSEGPYEARESRDAAGALSLLSDTAMMRKGAKEAGVPSDAYPNRMSQSPTSFKHVGAQEAGRGDGNQRRARRSTVDMHLSALPAPTSMSKMPFSSDRSTNVLTPTPTPPLSADPMHAHMRGSVGSSSSLFAPLPSRMTAHQQ